MPININHQTNQIVTAYRPNSTNISTGTNFNLALANDFIRDAISGNTTFTISNPFTGLNIFTVRFTYTSGIITWFTGIAWDGGSTPSLTASKDYEFVFKSRDGGSTWQGAISWSS
jgi:hypothetical protein